MASEARAARPRQVTMATVMAVVGSLVLVVGLFDTLARLRTPEMRDSIDDMLARPPGSSLGVESAQVIDAMRALVFVSGALAATALVLGVFLLQKHRGARVGLTVVAVLLLVTIPVAGLMPLFIAVAAGLAWSKPARDWFSGPPPAAPPVAPPVEQRVALPVESRIEQHAEPQAGPEAGTRQQPWGSPPVPWQPPVSAYGWSERRPTTVTIAVVLTWFGAGAVAGLTGLTALVLATDSNAFLDQLDAAVQDSGLSVSPREALAVGWAVTAVLLGWSLTSILLAVFAFRRSNAARVALAASAAMAALLSLLTIVALVPVITLLLAGTTVVLLFTGGANEWYRTRDHRPPPGFAAHPFPPPAPPAPRQKQKPW